MGIYFIALGLLIAGGILAALVKDNWKLKVCTIFSGISSFCMIIPALYSLFTNQEIIQGFELPLFGNINFIIDPLSAFFILIISIISFLGIIYANGYLKPYLNKGMNTSSHCFFLMGLTASMLTVVTCYNALFFLVVWEAMSLSSFFLVIFESSKKEVLNAGIKYMVYMHISVIFIIAAFALANIHAGSFDFMDFHRVLSENKHLADIVFLLAFIGFGTKAGLVPFHNWLPDAHPAAPSHVSGIMSGVMIKTGIYGILRMLYVCGNPSKFTGYLILTISIVSALWGLLYAITQHDIKRLLAYSSIENIGIMGIGFGIGILGIAYNNPVVAVLGFAGGIMHILNHSIFKSLLFFASGSVYQKTHTRDIELLGGLIKKMPTTAFLFIIGSVAICGLPPFNGFISEFIIYAAMLFGLPADDTAGFMTIIISLASLAFIGTMAILCFTKYSGTIFLGNPRSEMAQGVEKDVSKVMLIPMGVLAFVALLIGIFPQFIMPVVLSPVYQFIHGSLILDIFSSVMELAGTISFYLLIFSAIVLSVFGIRFVLNRKSEKHNTWGCGYNKPNNRMQYTASSYADLFVTTVKPIFKRIIHIKKPKDIFPKEAYYEMEVEDIEEAYIVKPLIKLDEKILTKFERIQNGNMQQYILFGLIFLVAAIVGLILFG